MENIPKVPMETAKIFDLAEALHKWMAGLKSKDGSWVVDSHEFLPANVTCDYAGKMSLINGIANTIEDYLSNRLVVSEKKLTSDGKGSKCIGIYLLES